VVLNLLQECKSIFNQHCSDVEANKNIELLENSLKTIVNEKAGEKLDLEDIGRKLTAYSQSFMAREQEKIVQYYIDKDLDLSQFKGLAQDILEQ
jgi:hypothetical protein